MSVCLEKKRSFVLISLLFRLVFLFSHLSSNSSNMGLHSIFFYSKYFDSLCFSLYIIHTQPLFRSFFFSFFFLASLIFHEFYANFFVLIVFYICLTIKSNRIANQDALFGWSQNWWSEKRKWELQLATNTCEFLQQLEMTKWYGV